MGRRLVEHAEHCVRSLASGRLVLKALGQYPGALRFYDRLGYRKQMLELAKIMG